MDCLNGKELVEVDQEKKIIAILKMKLSSYQKEFRYK